MTQFAEPSFFALKVGPQTPCLTLPLTGVHCAALGAPLHAVDKIL